VFHRGYDVYDQRRLGFQADVPEEPEKDGGRRRYFRFDVALPGNGNGGHEGPAYGTTLGDDDKDALVEFLKTF
jgi:hypothetical protein